MIDKDKRYRTPCGEIVTGAELVEATAEDVIRAVIEKLDGWTDGQFTENIVTALREAEMLKEPDSTMSELARLGQEMQPEMYEVDPEGWIKHDVGPCPVDDDVMVEVRLANGGRCTARARVFVWRNDAVVGRTYITHYRVVGE